LLSRQSGSDADLTGYLRSALTAILGTEQGKLTEIGPIARGLQEQVASIKAGSMSEQDC
jgi:hypothetical protein